jgi:hypothetical protein
MNYNQIPNQNPTHRSFAHGRAISYKFLGETKYIIKRRKDHRITLPPPPPSIQEVVFVDAMFSITTPNSTTNKLGMLQTNVTIL